MTFSKSLAQYLTEKLSGSELKQFTFVVSKKLNSGEKSNSGLYGIVRKDDSWMLRITLFFELAEMSRDNTRDIVEVYLNVKNN